MCDRARPATQPGPAILRISVTKVVSKIGTTAPEQARENGHDASRPAASRTVDQRTGGEKKPTNIEPQSPMKIDCRVMVVDEKSDQCTSECSQHQRFGHCWLTNEVQARNVAAIAETPTARPSILSSMFTAFVIPTSQNIVIKNVD